MLDQNFHIPKKIEIANFNITKSSRFSNNPFGVDDPFKEKPVGWFAQAETENCPGVKF